MIPVIEPPDSFLVRAAQGWLELGCADEAAKELAHVSRTLAEHPEVLELGWHIHSKLGQWQECVAVAERLSRSCPELPSGWVHLSFALHELKRTEEARDNLLRIQPLFSEDPLICYNLACYECQMGRLGMAREWLDRAFELGGRKRYLAMAKEDPDLVALRDQLP